MNLYLISQSVNRNYDTFSAAVVAAESRNEARQIHPGQGWEDDQESCYSEWAPTSDDVIVEKIGITTITEKGIILSSFHAG